ncbi:MAG: transposase [bacterium]
MHFEIPGGGISADGKWLPAHWDYLMPAKALARIFRAKFRDALKKTALFKGIPPETWKKEWVSLTSESWVKARASSSTWLPTCSG